jgi:uncharacterized protein YndB with AHSA1/START domain
LVGTYTIERAIDIDAPIEVVWRTITEPDQIRRWFADAVVLEARSGAVGTLSFGDRATEAHVVAITVVEADRPRRFSFRWVQPPGVEAGPDNSMLVTFELTADGAERTWLRVAETGLEGLEWAEEEKERYVEQHRHGWLTYGDKLQGLFSSPPLA